MSWATIVGTLAAIVGVSAFLPQAWHIIKTRKTDDLSTPMWIMQVTAFSLWIAYGIGLRELPIIIPNSICVILSSFILAMKLLPAQKRDKVADVVEKVVPDAIASR